MIVRFDALNRFELPLMTVCNPGSKFDFVSKSLSNVVGGLIDTSDEELVLNFNSSSELNFRAYNVKREDPSENAYATKMYRSLQNRRMIFVEDIGYFVITSVTESYDGGMIYKDVSAKSADIELQQKMVPYIEDGTYKLKKGIGDNADGILDIISATLPMWTIGDVDSTIANKWRTFEDVDVNANCLSFLLENVQDAYECIVVFDTIRRRINVYDQESFVKRTNVHLTKDDLISSLDVEENSDDIYTAISVLGDGDITIAAVNPLGTNTIYNFTYYLDWMGEELGTKVRQWQEAISYSATSYLEKNKAYYELLADASNLEQELNKLNIQLTMYRRCRENIVAESDTSLVGSYNTVIVENGGEPIEVYEEIAETLAHIDELIAERETEYATTQSDLNDINDQLAVLSGEIEEIRNTVAFDSYFTAEELETLQNYIYQGSYTDSYVVFTDIMSYADKFEQMKILYDRAKSQLKKISQPTQQFTIDAENFLFEKEFAGWSDQLETGCLINVELLDGDVAELFLSNFTVNYEDHSLSMTFGNRFNKFDPKSLFDDVLGNISKSANTLEYIKDVVTPIKNGELNQMQAAIQASRDLTMSSALSSTGETVIIDGSGYTGKKMLASGEYDPHQVKITGKNIVFTDNSWESAKIAIGEILFGDGESSYGVNAQTLIGDLIMGNNLRILDNDGNDLFTVIDGRITASVSGDIEELNNRITSIVEQLPDSFTIRFEELWDGRGEADHVTTSNNFTFNQNGLFIHEEGSEIVNKIDNSGMYVSRMSGQEEESVLTANNEGVDALNLRSRQYLIVGDYSRFENYAGNRTACFYIGG